jgi:hypothetical protein
MFSISENDRKQSHREKGKCMATEVTEDTEATNKMTLRRIIKNKFSVLSVCSVANPDEIGTVAELSGF